ncbi:hypothetical protein KIAC18_002543 [Sporomusa sphaeroides]|uniref:hypothetical protein n=1 Tax=Sporomusa sphaeroides TaxID=47679 RepID=UPI003DA160CF
MENGAVAAEQVTTLTSDIVWLEETINGQKVLVPEVDEYQKLSEHQIETGIDPDTGERFEVDPNTGKPYEILEPELSDALNNIPIPGLGTMKYRVNSGGLNYNLATATDYINNAIQLRNGGITALGNTALNKAIFDDLKSTYKIAQEHVPGLGLAAKVEVEVSTTSGSTMILKGISKVGVCAIRSIVYDIHTDSKAYSGAKLAIAAAIDAGGTIVAAGAGTIAVGLGAPVYAVVLGGSSCWLFDKPGRELCETTISR